MPTAVVNSSVSWVRILRKSSGCREANCGPALQKPTLLQRDPQFEWVRLRDGVNGNEEKSRDSVGGRRLAAGDGVCGGERGECAGAAWEGILARDCGEEV